MARDNGSRGLYRHSSTSANELKENISQDREHKYPPLVSTSPASSSPVTATPPTTFQSLKKLDARSNNGFLPTATATDGLFDRAPDLLNVRFPAISHHDRSVPGSLPRHSLSFLHIPLVEAEERDGVTWVDVAIANFTLGATAIGFLIIMYDGVSTIFRFVWDGIMGMLMSR